MLTANPAININRIKTRVANGGHSVPDEKVISRYCKALDLILRLVEVCDVCHIYDNTNLPARIFKKRKNKDRISVTDGEFRLQHVTSRLTNGTLGLQFTILIFPF